MLNRLRYQVLLVFAAILCGCESAHEPSENGFAARETSKNEEGSTILAGATCQRPSGHHMYFEEFECPIGGEKFSALQLGTHSTFGSYLDFEPKSYMSFPAPMAICPSNGFVLYKDEFTSEELAKIEAKIRAPEYQSLIGDENSYYIFGRFIELNEIEGQDLWWIYLVATWEADQCGSIEKYTLYAKASLVEAEKTMSEIDVDDEDYFALALTISNLNRRLGNFEKAELASERYLHSAEFEPDENEAIVITSLDLAITERDTGQRSMFPEES